MIEYVEFNIMMFILLIEKLDYLVFNNYYELDFLK